MLPPCDRVGNLGHQRKRSAEIERARHKPTGNLDADLSGEILELMKSANARGTTVVLATHNRELLKRWRRRVVRLEQGRVAEDGCPEA